MKTILILALLWITANPSLAQDRIKDPARVVFPGTGACLEPWAKEIQEKYSVRLEIEYRDVNGNLLNGSLLPGRQNPEQRCSGSLVRVGKTNKVKMISAAHCRLEYRFKRSSPLDPPPIPLRAMTLTASVGGREPRIAIKNVEGPEYSPKLTDKEDSFRKNDFLYADLDLEQLPADLNPSDLPELCDPNMKMEDIQTSVVIGYGATNSGESSKQPLCGDQPIASVGDGTITAPPYGMNKPGACPGDSGGGLWVMRKGSTQPCLAGAVSGPKSSSVDKDKTTNQNLALRQCTQPGIEAMFSAVYQNRDLIAGFGNANPAQQNARGQRQAQ